MRRPGPSRARPVLEQLEDRLVPAPVYGPPVALDITSGGQTANGAVQPTNPAQVSADGRYAVFVSSATDLKVANFSGTLPGYPEVYLRDLVNGTTTLVSLSPNGQPAVNGGSLGAVISADGRYVAFTSSANNLINVPVGKSASGWQVYVWDRTTGAIALASPSDDSATTNNLGGNGVSGYDPISISDASQSTGGVVVAFNSTATDLDPSATDSNGAKDVYAFNLSTGKVQLVSLATDGLHSGNAASTAPVVSADGSTVAFLSSATNLDPNATVVAVQNVYARKLSAAHPALVSAEVSTPSPANNDSTATAQTVSADGRYEVFSSYATDLISGISVYGQENVYLRDRTTGAITLVSAAYGSTGLVGGAYDSWGAVISADGRYVAFSSVASNLINVPSGKSVSDYQVYVWDRTTGAITLASPSDDSATTNNLGGNGHSGLEGDPISISDAGQSGGGVVVAFVSQATDLDPSAIDSNGAKDVYAFNVSTGKVQLVSTAGDGVHSGNAASTAPVVSADGSTVAFLSSATNLDPNATIVAAQDVYARKLSAAHPVLVSISVSGNQGGNNTSADPAISANGRYVAFDSNATNLTAVPLANNYSNVYVRDLSVSGATTLISVNAAGTASGSGSSSEPSLSADGSTVAFSSNATDLVSVPSGKYVRNFQVYVRNRTTGPSTLVTPGADSATTNNLGDNNTSGNPVLSADGSTVVFVSLATDLVGGLTTNGHYQVYVERLGGAVVLATPGSAGTGGNADADTNALPALDANGGVAVFDNSSSNLVPSDVYGDSRNPYDRIVYDFSGVALGLVSAKPAGIFSYNQHAVAENPAISANGRYVAFDSNAPNLSPLPIISNDSHNFDVYVRDLSTGANTLISVNAAGTASGSGISTAPSLSAAGGEVAFSSNATDLISVPSGKYVGNFQVYVRNRTTGPSTLVTPGADSATTNNLGGNNTSGSPVLSADGSTVAFLSVATDLIGGLTTNGHYQVYVEPLGGAIALATPSSGGTGGNADADTNGLPALDANGDTLLYDSNASNLVANDSNSATDVFAVKAVTLSVSSTSGPAPSSGTTTFPFTVSLSTPIAQMVTVQYATQDGTAHAPGDYQSASGTLTFIPGGATSQTINVTVNGTTATHASETFSVTLSSPSNATIASGTGTGTILTNDTPPVVTGAAVNGNSAALAGAQRSMVDSIVYTFDHAVNLAAGAFTIALHQNVTVNGVGGQAVGTLPTLNWASSDGGLTWVVTFSGSGVGGGSIADGVYDLTLNAAAVSDAFGLTMSASRTDTFFRLYGDTNGDGAVNASDALPFKTTYLKGAGQAGYLAYLDYNGDGVVNATDALQFKKRFLTSYTGFTATI